MAVNAARGCTALFSPLDTTAQVKPIAPSHTSRVVRDDPRSPNDSTTEAGQPLTTSDLSHTPAARLESRVAGRDAETTALQARLSDTMSRLAESRNSSSDTGGFGEIVIAHTDNKPSNHRALSSQTKFGGTSQGVDGYQTFGASISATPTTLHSLTNRSEPTVRDLSTMAEGTPPRPDAMDRETSELYARIEAHHSRAKVFHEIAHCTDNSIEIHYHHMPPLTPTLFMPTARHVAAPDLRDEEPGRFSQPLPPGQSSLSERPRLQAKETSSAQVQSRQIHPETLWQAPAAVAPRLHPQLQATESSSSTVRRSARPAVDIHDGRAATALQDEITELQSTVMVARDEQAKEDALLLKAETITMKFRSNLEAEERRLVDLKLEVDAYQVETREASTAAASRGKPCPPTSIDDDFDQLLEETEPESGIYDIGHTDSSVTNTVPAATEPGPDLPGEHVVDRDDPRPCLVLYDYNPLTDSPNENPRAELPLTAGELVSVISDVRYDGFVVAEKDDPNAASGHTVQGLVANTFLTTFDNLNPDEANAAVEDAQAVVMLDRLARDEVHLDEVGGEFVVVSPLNERERAVIGNAVDYVVVQQPTLAESNEADALANRDGKIAPVAEQKSHSPDKQDGRPKAKLKKRSGSVLANAPHDRMDKWKRRLPRSPALKRKVKSGQALTNDLVVLQQIKQMMNTYPIKWVRIRETKAYGAPNTQTEKYRVIAQNDDGDYEYETGDDVHIMRKANVVLVQETHTFTLHREKSTDKLVEEVWGSWTPFDKYSKRYLVNKGLVQLPRMSQVDISGPDVGTVIAKQEHVHQEIHNLEETLKSKTALEHSRAALLREQIATEREALETEIVLEDDLMEEIQNSNADLQIQLQQKRAITRDGVAPLQRMDPGLKSTVKMKTTRNKVNTLGVPALTVDEAITAAILVVQEEFPDVAIRPAHTKKPYGSFQTYDINGVKTLLTVRGSEVRVRSAHAWVSLPEFVAELAARFEAEGGRRKRLEAERKAKQTGKLQDAIDVKVGNKQLMYRTLVDAYHREQKKVAVRQREGDDQLAKEHASVEALEAELQHITELQKAARARRHELLDSMEDKNNELLGRIAAAETQIHKEEVSGLVFGGSTRLHEKKKAAVRARQEYEVLKEKIDADTATGVTPDIDALLKKYQEEAVAFEVTLRDSNSEDNLLAASSTMADVPSDANFEKNEVIATSTFRVAPDLDDLERDVQDAKLQQSMVKAAEDDLDALFMSVDTLKAGRS